MENVTPNVFTETKLRGCNPSFVTTSDGVVVIDTPQLPTKAVEMRKQAESHGPIRYLINTEHHVDHIFGNYYFKGAGTVVNHRGVYDGFMVVYPELDPFAYASRRSRPTTPRASPSARTATSTTAIRTRARSSSPATSPFASATTPSTCSTRPATPRDSSPSTSRRSASSSPATRSSPAARPG